MVLDDESDESAADEVQIMEPARPLPHSSKLAQRVAILFPLFGKYTDVLNITLWYHMSVELQFMTYHNSASYSS